MVSRSYINGFIPAGKEANTCINCGFCLQECPVMRMDKRESNAEFKRLLDGEEPYRVLNECTFCFSCNHYCFKGLKPYALIMERMTAKNRAGGKGIPAAAEHMFTGKHESGYFFDIYSARDTNANMQGRPALPTGAHPGAVYEVNAPSAAIKAPPRGRGSRLH